MRDAGQWGATQACIATCQACIPENCDLVANPLIIGEIPDPPELVDVLFVGVAPPALNGKHKGQHFWSNATDALRVGLFGVLDGLLGSELRTLNRGSKAAADDDFRDRRFFFVHSCKVRPVPAMLKAPPEAVIAVCARRHLAEEIVALRPRAVCFLGHNTLPAARLLGLSVDDQPVTAELRSETSQWNGLGMATVQPIRGAERRTTKAILNLFDEARLPRHGQLGG